MQFAKIALAASALAFAAAPALAQDANPQVVTGATVYGPEGGTVGTIVSIADGIVTVDTGTHKAPLPANAFGKGEQGPRISVTKLQIDQMIAQQKAAAEAKRDAALLVGANVVTADGQVLGTVESVEGDNVVVTRDAGPIQLLREHFAVDAANALMALFTLEQIEAAASGNAGATMEADAAAE